MQDLILKLEEATEGSRELDAEIVAHFYETDKKQFWPFAPGSELDQKVPRYTENLQDALGMLDSLPRKPHWRISYPVAEAELVFSGGPVITANAATPALALVIACLKARKNRPHEGGVV